MWPSDDEYHVPPAERWMQTSAMDMMEHSGQPTDHLPAIPQTAASSRQQSPPKPPPSPQHLPTFEKNDFNLVQPFQDPRARMYSSHNRRIRNFRSEGLPRPKMGRAGGSWRHVSFTNGYQGNNILFIEGTVKQDDARAYPPYGWRHPADAHFMHYVSPRVIPRTAPLKQHPVSPALTSRVNARAKHGFKYWYEEKKPRTNDWLWQTPEVTAKVN